mgnify:CR=1 FL=1
MMRGRNSIPLGRIFGIPIGLDLSWFLIFALLTWSMATSYFPARFPDWSTTLYWGIGAITAIGLFVGVLLHELGHARVALWYQVPVRRIRLMVFGGVAELGDEPPHAGAEFLIALAGPAVSLLLAAALGFAWGVMKLFAPTLEQMIALTGYLAIINLSLAVFNLLPGFPLDGGRVLRSAVWGLTGNLTRATTIAAGVGRLIAYAFIGVGVLQAFTGNLSGGLWTAFIGIFLQGAAGAEVQSLRIREILSRRTVAQAMRAHFPAIPAEISVQRLVDSHILGAGWRSFIVRAADGSAGLLSASDVHRLARERWPLTTAGQIMHPIDTQHRVELETGLWSALKQMDGSGVDQLAVMEDGEVRGLLRREDVFGYIRTVMQFGS